MEAWLIVCIILAVICGPALITVILVYGTEGLCFGVVLAIYFVVIGVVRGFAKAIDCIFGTEFYDGLTRDGESDESEEQRGQSREQRTPQRRQEPVVAPPSAPEYNDYDDAEASLMEVEAVPTIAIAVPIPRKGEVRQL